MGAARHPGIGARDLEAADPLTLPLLADLPGSFGSFVPAGAPPMGPVPLADAGGIAAARRVRRSRIGANPLPIHGATM